MLVYSLIVFFYDQCFQFIGLVYSLVPTAKSFLFIRKTAHPKSDSILCWCLITIAGLIVDLRGNGLFHRELAVGAKIDPYGRGHLQRRGGSRGWNGRWSGWWRPRPSSGFRLISLLKEVAVVWNIIGVQGGGVIPKVPKTGS